LADSFHAVVVGAGPAGSVLALRLAQLGKRVVLIEKTGKFGRRSGESLTPSVLPLLDAAGLRVRLEDNGYLRPRTAHIIWAGESRLADASGFIVDRAGFDSMLIDAACEAGVHVIRPTRIADYTFNGAWSIRLDNRRMLTASFMADAAGRTRMLPDRKSQYGVRTFALCGHWCDVDTSKRNTIVEAGPSAWYWGAPLDDGLFSAMVFVDRPASRLQPYQELIDASSLLAHRLRRARCIQLNVCDATPFFDTAPVDEHSIKVGDAALSLDPLSSQGIQTAIGTALHAAAVINTILDRPQDRDLAMEFYSQRLRQSTNFHSNASASFYREQFRICPTDFWRARAHWPVLHTSTAQQRNNQVPVVGMKIRLSPRARFVCLGASNGCHIFSEDAVELDGNAVAYVMGVRLRDLLEPLNVAVRVDELIARWTAHVKMEKAHQIFRWAWAEGWIEPVDRACEFVHMDGVSETVS
jgi:flavin-dependent dehydrogenase